MESGALFSRPLLGTNTFISYCKDRNVPIDRTRLLRFERLGIFGPIFRVRTPPHDTPPFYLPVRESNNWFDKGLAWDTTALGGHDVPAENDQDHEAYYSVFQIDYLALVVRQLSLTVHLDSYLEAFQHDSTKTIDASKWLDGFNEHLCELRKHEYRRSIALLCQFISERYYPYARSDQRTIQITRGSYYDTWISAYVHDRKAGINLRGNGIPTHQNHSSC